MTIRKCIDTWPSRDTCGWAAAYVVTAVLVTTLSLWLAGCASGGLSTGNDQISGGHSLPALQPGDAIRIQVWREADLSGTFLVDDRGVVTLPLLGERVVNAMPPAEVRASLLNSYASYLQNPSVEITLLRRISILGEVRSPGLYPVDATVSLADAIALAGGITPNGNPNDLRLVRGDQVIRQDLNQATLISSADVRSGDQIVVGEKSWLARNPAAIIGSVVAAAGIIAAALITR